MNRLLLLLVVLIMVLGLAQSVYAVEQKDLDRISNKFVCTCGCGNMLIGSCSCEKATQMKKVIGAKLDTGLSEKQIADEFVSLYGLEILAEPPKKGFNLMAWIMPFAGVIAAGGLIYYSVRNWTDQHQARLEQDSSNADEQDKYSEKLEKELKEWI